MSPPAPNLPLQLPATLSDRKTLGDGEWKLNAHTQMSATGQGLSHLQPPEGHISHLSSG